MSDYLVPSPAAQRWTAGATRDLTIAVGDARTAILQVIRSLGFATTSEQYSLIEAERGSKLRGLSLTRSRVPVAVRVGLTPDGSGCRLDIGVEDRWGATARSRAAVAVYADVFTEVLSALDEALRRADPKAASSFPYWWRNLPESEASAGSSTAGTAARVEGAVQRRTSRLLDGPRRGPTTAVAEAGVATVVFASPEAVARIAADVVDGMLTAGQLVAGAPGAMPPTLVEQVQAMVVLLEERLAAVGRGGMPGELVLQIAKADQPVVSFLSQQAALREKLPVRLLMSCTTCRLEKVINPDFVRMRERSRRIKVLSSSVGAVFGSHHISPFILVGRLSQVKKSDPDFVCTRCQGTDADEKPITFCPRCGDRRTESVLRTCSKCELDLRTLLPGGSVWRELEAPEPEAGPAPGPAPGSAPEPVAEPVAAGAVGAPPLPPAPAAPPIPTDAPAPPGGWVAPAPSGWVAPAASGYAPPARRNRRASPRPVQAGAPAGWYPDPWQRAEQRYWDGAIWTLHVISGGTAWVDRPDAPGPTG